MKKIKWIFLLFVLLLTGCSQKPSYHAKVIDSAVEGIEYQCAGDVGFSSKNGEIECVYMPLGFKIGNIKIGILYSIPEDGIIFPQDMLGVARENITDENVQKLTMLLQTLDSDNNASNGITISLEESKKLKDFIDLKKISISDLQEYLETKLNKEAILPQKALKHLQKTMKKYNIAVDIDESYVAY